MGKSTFVQLHLLTAYPPANLNRDDMGRPKTAIVGGAQRLRVSSQSLKRAWRTSDVFADKLEGHIGVRTKHVSRAILDRLGEIDPKKAEELAVKAAAQFGKLKKSKDKGKTDLPETEQLVHLSPREIAAIKALAEAAAKGEEISEEALKLLGRAEGAADIALFGRMLADHPEHNVEAAAQVAHAFTIHKALVEEDYYAAVDDLQEKDNAGAGHIGVGEFGAGVFYQYVCVNLTELTSNLGDAALAARTLQALVEAAATVAPKGKIASYGSSARASFIMAEKGHQTPRSLMSAFVNPVGGGDVLARGVEQLLSVRDRLDAAYGPCADARKVLDVMAGTGTLAEILEFVGADA